MPTTDEPFLLYGSYGYTGSLIARAAVDAGAPLILAGRDGGRLRAQSETLGLPYRVAALDDERGLAEALRGVGAVLHLAGPYAHTSRLVVDACLRAGVHYLDVTGEHAVFEALRARSEEARAAGITILPGVGFDVVPSDCLALYVAGRLPGATRLEIAVRGVAGVSQGTARTMVEAAPGGGYVRRDGRLVWVPAGWRSRRVALGRGTAQGWSVPLPDLTSAYHSTGIPNITTYYLGNAATGALLRASRILRHPLAARCWRAIAHRAIGLVIRGPTQGARGRGEALVWAEASADDGRAAAALLRCPEPYSLTAATALESARRVLAGQGTGHPLPAGYLTPAMAFGPDYVLGFAGVRREDIAPSPALAAPRAPRVQ